MELTLDNIIGIVSLLLSAATLYAMVTNFRVLKKGMIPNMTIYGEEADKIAGNIQTQLPKAVLLSDTQFMGRETKITPQFRIENSISIQLSSAEKLKGVVKVARYYYRSEKDQTKIMVKTWCLI